MVKQGAAPFRPTAAAAISTSSFVYYRDYVEVWGFTINMDRWNKIEADDQAIIQEVVSKEVAERMAGAEQEDQEYLNKLADHGLTVVDLADTSEKTHCGKGFLPGVLV